MAQQQQQRGHSDSIQPQEAATTGLEVLSLPATNENDTPGLTGLVFNGIPLVEDVEDDSPSNLTLHSCKEQWARLFRRNWQISACFGRASRYESAFEMSGVPVSLVLDFFGDAHEKGKPRRSGALKDGLVHPRFQWYFIPPRESPRLLKLIGGAEMRAREFLNRDGTLYQRVSVMKVVVKYSEALGHLHVSLALSASTPLDCKWGRAPKDVLGSFGASLISSAFSLRSDGVIMGRSFLGKKTSIPPSAKGTRARIAPSPRTKISGLCSRSISTNAIRRMAWARQSCAKPATQTPKLSAKLAAGNAGDLESYSTAPCASAYRALCCPTKLTPCKNEHQGVLLRGQLQWPVCADVFALFARKSRESSARHAAASARRQEQRETGAPNAPS